MDVKSLPRDWRLPVIFAVPVLLWAGLLYLIFQPLPGSKASAAETTVSITMNPTAPWHAVSGTPYPSVAPKPTERPVCAHPTTGYIIKTLAGVVVLAEPGTVCP